MQSGYTPIPTGNASRIPLGLIPIAGASLNPGPQGTGGTSRNRKLRREDVNHPHGTKRNSARFNGKHRNVHAAAVGLRQ